MKLWNASILHFQIACNFFKLIEKISYNDVPLQRHNDDVPLQRQHRAVTPSIVLFIPETQQLRARKKWKNGK